jgi:sugar phosphate isomerase/epimerase
MKTSTTHLFPKRLGCAVACILGLLVLPLESHSSPSLDDDSVWRLGIAAWSFNRFTFFEAVEKTAALGVRHIEAFEGQPVGDESESIIGLKLSDLTISKIVDKLASAGVKLTSIYIHNLPAGQEAARSYFRLCRKLGVEFIVSEPPLEAMEMLDQLCNEYGINLAIHNHPHGSSTYWHPLEVLKACEKRSSRVGACADTGHWQRSGINPVEGVRLLGQRLLSLHLKDLNSPGPAGHDVPWGKGQGRIGEVLHEVRKLGIQPKLFTIEYEHNWENNSPEIALCASYFNQTKAASAAPPSPIFRAGAHQVDVSPVKLPVIVNGMFTERSSSNIADRLHAKALVLDNGHTRAALCVIDTCMMPRSLIDHAKELASIATRIQPDHIIISATHTHSAPSAMGCLGSRADDAYAAWLPAKIAEAIAGADRNLTPAQVGWTAVDDWEHTFNRRWIRRPDRQLTDPFGGQTVRAHMHPGHESPDAIGPSGPVDPAISLLAVRSLDRTPLAVFANYSQHYYGSPLLSSDYYGRFAQHLSKLLETGENDPAFIAIMSQGTSGDLMWMDYGAPPNDIGYEAYGLEIAQMAFKAYRDLNWHDWAPLKAAERNVTLGHRVPDPQRLAWARQTVQSIGTRLPQTLPEIYALEAIHLHERQRAELKLQALRLGSLGITAIPNEVFAITGLKLKSQSPLPLTFNITLANGAEGYIPPPEQHKLGGYTTWPARTAGLEIDAEPRIVETLLALLEEVASKPRLALKTEHGPYAKSTIEARPVAYWRLDEMVTPVAHDCSGSANDAEFEDGVALFLPGAGSGSGLSPNPRLSPSSFSGRQINRAAHFAGGRLRARLPELGDHYTVELWLWNGLVPDARPVTGYFYSRGVDGEEAVHGEHLGIGGTNHPGQTGRLILFNGNQSNLVLTGRTPLKLRAWHHVALVRQGTHAAVYLDGKLEIAGEMAITMPPNSTTFFAGRSDRFASFEGRLDEIAVYNRALDPEQIVSKYKSAGVLKID